MTRPARSIARRWFSLAGLLTCSVIGCTKLADPKDSFGSLSAGASGVPSGGTGGAPASGGAGSGGEAPAGAAGMDAVSGGGGTSGRNGAGGGSCLDAQGLHGLGCYACAPTDIGTLENACTDAVCTELKSQRLPPLGADGKLPPLPVASGGAGGAGTGGAGAGGAGAGSGGTGGSSAGSSGESCADLAKQGAVVYVTGSSASKPFLQQIAQQLVAQKIYVVYSSTGSCVGVDAIVNGTPMTTGPSPAPAASATYWESSSSTGRPCDLPSAGVPADIGVSDVFAQSCAGFELTSLDSLQIRDAHGPIQTMTFAVPASSPYHEISAQAAYFVFGFGAAGQVLDAPSGKPMWNDEAWLLKRSATSGTQAMIAAAIGVPPAAWKGKAHKTSDDVATDIQNAGGAQQTASLALGILAADYIDSKNLRAQVRVLGFQDSAQKCAFFPDSTEKAHDKRNVRDGHYPIWGPLHLLLKVDQFGNPRNPANRQAVTDIVGYLSGTKVLPNGVQLIDVYAQSGLVPECAMRVTRTKDGGNILPYQPPSPCACLFEAKATGNTSCTTCQVQGDCTTGETCSQGYCER